MVGKIEALGDAQPIEAPCTLSLSSPRCWRPGPCAGAESGDRRCECVPDPVRISSSLLDGGAGRELLDAKAFHGAAVWTIFASGEAADHGLCRTIAQEIEGGSRLRLGIAERMWIEPRALRDGKW